MFNVLIENYITKLSKEDIIIFANKENIIISSNEIEFLYTTIKKDYHLFLNGNHNDILEKFKNNINEKALEQILNLYQHYKSIYKI